MSKSVCVPVDDSPGTQRAVDWAVRNALRSNSKLSLLCVRSVLSDPFAVEAASSSVRWLCTHRLSDTVSILAK